MTEYLDLERSHGFFFRLDVSIFADAETETVVKYKSKTKG